MECCIERWDRNELQLVLPKKYYKQVIKSSHDELGHSEMDRVMDILKDHFNCPFMNIDIGKYLARCDCCLRFKGHLEWNELYPLLAMSLLDLVHMDYLTNENPATCNDVNVLVILDHFHHYSKVVVTSHLTDKVMAQAFWNHFIVDFGLSKKLLTDQG